MCIIHPPSPPNIIGIPVLLKKLMACAYPSCLIGTTFSFFFSASAGNNSKISGFEPFGFANFLSNNDATMTVLCV